MCGLLAGVGKLNSNRIIALGSMSEDRGTDSVGIAYVSGGEVHIAKVAARPCVGLNIALRKEVTEAAVSGMFIGHTRAATQGAITSKNAHPFLVDDIAFAHNGIILNDETFGKYTVDSESLIHGIKAKDFSKYAGPIALVWIENGLLHAYRGGNPLFRGRHGTATYLASDSEYLRAVGCTKIKELSEGFIYTFHSATCIATKRVPINKTYQYVERSTALAPMTYNHSWKDDYYEKWGADLHYKLDAPRIAESFDTWKDEKDKRHTEAYALQCAMCNGDAERGDYCAECYEWMKSEGIQTFSSEVTA